MQMRHDVDDDPGPGGLSVTVSRQGATLALVVHGELDLATAPVLEVALDSIAPDVAEVVVDLDDVTVFGSTGVDLLVGAGQRLATAGTRLRVQGGRALTRRVIEVCGVAEVLALAG